MHELTHFDPPTCSVFRLLILSKGLCQEATSFLRKHPFGRRHSESCKNAVFRRCLRQRCCVHKRSISAAPAFLFPQHAQHSCTESCMQIGLNVLVTYPWRTLITARCVTCLHPSINRRTCCTCYAGGGHSGQSVSLCMLLVSGDAGTGKAHQPRPPQIMML